jgi:2-polyprenyl-6-hydroxyphenyl methylase/3-demethylubiquinone-9 3-methyltransferase
MTDVAISGYRFADSQTNRAHDVLLPALREELALLGAGGARRLFELGCGNGSVAALLHGDGWEVTGVDPSHEGIAQARLAYPHLRLASGSAYDDLAQR